MRSNRKQKVFVSRAFAMLLSILMVLATFMPSGVFAENPVEDETVVAEMFETEDADSIVETEAQFGDLLQEPSIDPSFGFSR